MSLLSFLSRSDREPVDGRSRRLVRTVPLVVLLGAAAVYFAWVAPGASKQYKVTLQFAGPTDNVRQVQTLWTRASDTDAQQEKQPIAGSTFRYALGKAPSSIVTSVRAPAGAYWLEVKIDGNGASRTERRKVHLEATQMTLFFSDEITRQLQPHAKYTSTDQPEPSPIQKSDDTDALGDASGDANVAH